MKIQALVFLLFINSILFSQTLSYPLITDRPDLTESSSIVPKGSLQIETGMVYESDEFTTDGVSTSVKSFNLATTLLRYGLTNLFELRLGSEYLMEKMKIKTQKETLKGINGLDLGTKIFLFNEKDYIPESSIIINVNFPVGNDAFNENKILPSMLFAMSHTLSEKIGLGYNLGGEWTDPEQLNYLYSIAVGIGLTERLSGFIETFGAFSKDVPSSIALDAGLTFLLNPTLQLDTSIGYSLTEENPDWFINAGFSWRIPE